MNFIDYLGAYKLLSLSASVVWPTIGVVQSERVFTSELSTSTGIPVQWQFTVYGLNICAGLSGGGGEVPSHGA